eukprot:6480448-Amphidinium_carterae.1
MIWITNNSGGAIAWISSFGGQRRCRSTAKSTGKSLHEWGQERYLADRAKAAFRCSIGGAQDVQKQPCGNAVRHARIGAAVTRHFAP